MKSSFRNIFNKFLSPFDHKDGNKNREHQKQQLLGVFLYNDDIVLLTKVSSNSTTMLELMKSDDGVEFDVWKKNVHIENELGKHENLDNCAEFSVFSEEPNFNLSYLRKNNGVEETVFATSSNLTEWKVRETTEHIRRPGVMVPGYTFDDQYIQYYGDGPMHLVGSRDGKEWNTIGKNVLNMRETMFDDVPLNPIGALEMHRGIFVLYDASKKVKNTTRLQLGGALFGSDNPQYMTWRSDTPLWEGVVDHDGEVVTLGSVFKDGQWFVYWRLPENKLAMVILQDPFFATDKKLKHQVKVCRYENNPILSPLPESEWEAEGAFNTAATCIDGQVHFLYRAVGRNGLSVLGYASSSDGLKIDERLEQPAYVPRKDFEGAFLYPGAQPRKIGMYKDLFLSGYSWGGCEDPKLTRIDDKIYLTYVAHAGWPPRTAISSISVDDFLAHRWEKWSDPQLLSAPTLDSKSACLLPEKVNGKFVIFHRTWPDVVVEYFDDLDFSDDNKWLASTPSIPMWRTPEGKCVVLYGKYPNIFTEHTEYTSDHDLQQSATWRNLIQSSNRISARANSWDSHKISMGSPPVKTDDGWLAIYSAVDRKDMSQYKIGAMLLDKNNPSRVLHRSNGPILKAETFYENDGKAGVVYPSGTVIKDDQLFVYYGGGDKHTCVATAPLAEFLQDLKGEVTSILKPVTV